MRIVAVGATTGSGGKDGDDGYEEELLAGEWERDWHWGSVEHVGRGVVRGSCVCTRLQGVERAVGPRWVLEGEE